MLYKGGGVQKYCLWYVFVDSTISCISSKIDLLREYVNECQNVH